MDLQCMVTCRRKRSGWAEMAWLARYPFPVREGDWLVGNASETLVFTLVQLAGGLACSSCASRQLCAPEPRRWQA